MTHMGAMRSQSGMTIVEVVIALAITSLMVAAVLAPGSGFRNRVRFSGAIDIITNQLRGIQNESADAVTQRSCPLDNSCGNTDYVAYGKVTEFSQDSSDVIVSTLVKPDSGIGSLQRCDSKVVTMNDGAVYTGSDQAIINVFSQDANKLYATLPAYAGGGGIAPACTSFPIAHISFPAVLVMTIHRLIDKLVPKALAVSVCGSASTNILNVDNYSPLCDNFYLPRDFTFRSADSVLDAVVTVDPSKNSISRRFTN